jgi:hypothetical protein
MTTIKGVDRSVQSLPCPTVEVNGVVVDNATVTFNEAVPSPTTTLTPDNFTANPAETPKASTATTERVTKIERLDENTYRETTVKSHLDEMTVTQVVNGIMIPNMRVMLASVLGTIDASVPNKDQKKAIKHLVRKQFDDAYCEIMRRAYLDCGFSTDMDYIVSPEPNRAKAYAEGFFK